MVELSLILTVPALPKIMSRIYGPSGTLRDSVFQTLDSVFRRTQSISGSIGIEVLLIDGHTFEEVTDSIKGPYVNEVSNGTLIADRTATQIYSHGSLKKRGLSKARGKWICFLEAGNVLSHEMVAEFKQSLDYHRQQSFDAFLGTTLNAPYPTKWKKELIKENWIENSPCFFKFSVLNKLKQIPDSSFGIALSALSSKSNILFYPINYPKVSNPNLIENSREWFNIARSLSTTLPEDLPEVLLAIKERAQIQIQFTAKNLKFFRSRLKALRK